MKGSFQEIIEGDKPVLIDFFATWCGPCQYQSPILDDVAKEVGEKARIIKIDVDKNQALAAKYQVRGVPTLMIFKSGEVKWKSSGVKMADELIQLINEHQ